MQFFHSQYECETANSECCPRVGDEHPPDISTLYNWGEKKSQDETFFAQCNLTLFFLLCRRGKIGKKGKHNRTTAELHRKLRKLSRQKKLKRSNNNKTIPQEFQKGAKQQNKPNTRLWPSCFIVFHRREARKEEAAAKTKSTTKQAERFAREIFSSYRRIS
jgi:hypothetical protein